MNPRILLCVATLLGSLPAASLLAQASAPAAHAETASPAAAAADAAQADLSALVERVKARLQEGKTAESDFAEELKAFDALAVKHAADKIDAGAMIGVMKAMLYIQVFEKPESAIPILEKVAADFPGTQTASQIPGMLDELKKTAAAEAATAVGTEFATFKETATDGTVVDLAAYRGKVVLVDFWATWCGPCVGELPHVKETYSKYHTQGFEVIGISLDEDGDKLASFTKEREMPWPQLFDGKGWQSKLAQAYGINSIPATFLLDRDGKIVAKGLRGDALAQKVGELLAAKNP